MSPQPARAPRTQAQRRDEMRHALLEAAVDSLVELGFARTTTLEVQRRAGVSRGALLHHFPSKAELLVATIAHLAERRGRDLKQRSLSLPTGPARVDAVLDLLWESFAGPMFQVAISMARSRSSPAPAAAGPGHALLLARAAPRSSSTTSAAACTGEGKSSSAADKVVDEIKAAGGRPSPTTTRSRTARAIVKTALDAFGRIDILINNAGILRDVSSRR
jgi:AcrR family transcriptional regulator